MLRPTGPRRQSKPQPSEFEAALRQNVPLLPATDVTVPSGAETQAVTIMGRPKVPDADPDREVIWTVDGSAVRFNLSTLLAKPAVARTTALNSKNAVVQEVGGKVCMLARSTTARSRFLFSADQAGTYAVAITISSIDLEPWARRSNAAKGELRDAIGASLAAGPGINITDDTDGRKRVAVTNPRPLAGGDLSAADKFAQPALDPAREWNLEAIQKTDPHLVRLDYDASAKAYRGTFPISADGSVTARLDYVRLGTLDHQGAVHPDAGKFVVTTFPADTSRTLANLFDKGAVKEIILQTGCTEEKAVTNRKFYEDVVKDTRITTSLAFVTKKAQVHDPSALGTEDTAYARINFRLTGGAVTGWNRDSSKDVDRIELRATRNGFTPGGLAVVPNGVVLAGDRYSGNVYAFKKGRRFSGADITTGIGFSAVNGMAYNRASNKLALTPGGYREPIKVFTLLQPGTAGQTLGAETNDSISGDELVAGVPFSLWCMAWHENDASDDDDLWVIDRNGHARVFRGGNHVAGKDVTLPGTEQVVAATFVGDVLIYGGDGSDVYAYNVATGRPVRGLELTGSQVTAGLSGFGLLCAAYDPDAAVLYLGGWGVHLAAFAAAKAVTAFPEASLYDYRTMSKTRLQAEVLDAPAGDEERSFKVMVSQQQPGGASEPRTLTGAQLKYHVGVLIATLSPAAGSYSASTLPQVYWDIEAKLPDGFGQVSPNRLHSKMTVPRQLPSTWLGLLVRVKIGGTVVSEVVLPWTAYAAPVAWNQRATGSGVNVYRVAATNDSTVRTVKIVLEREWTGDTDTIYLVGNDEPLLANTVFELLAWV